MCVCVGFLGLGGAHFLRALQLFAGWRGGGVCVWGGGFDRPRGFWYYNAELGSCFAGHTCWSIKPGRLGWELAIHAARRVLEYETFQIPSEPVLAGGGGGCGGSGRRACGCGDAARGEGGGL
jgi:hypothetical protein